MSTTETASTSGPKAVDLAALKTKVRVSMFQLNKKHFLMTSVLSFVAEGEAEGEGGLPKHAAARL